MRANILNCEKIGVKDVVSKCVRFHIMQIVMLRSFTLVLLSILIKLIGQPHTPKYSVKEVANECRYSAFPAVVCVL